MKQSKRGNDASGNNENIYYVQGTVVLSASNVFNPHNNSVTWVLFLSPFFSSEKTEIK